MQDSGLQEKAQIHSPSLWKIPPLLSVVITAALTVAIFPRLELSWLAPVCFVPLLLLVPSHGRFKLFLFFGLSGVLFHLGNLYWIVHVIQHYTSLGFLLSACLLFLLCLVLSLFWGTFGMVLGAASARAGFGRAMISAPFLWIVLEWARNHLTHFPWCALGDSQYNHLRLAQLATFFGVYGLSCLLMAANSAIATAIVLRKYRYLILTIVIMTTSIFYGNDRIRKPVTGESLKVGCIQGNIPQDVKINYKFADEINRRHLRMTTELLQSQRPDIIFWSEASTLFPLRSGGEWTQQILDLARNSRVPLLIGSDSFVDDKIYNTAFLVNDRGKIEAEYSKMYLVPFGEYVPFNSILFFAGKVVPEISDFLPGEHYTLFPLKGNSFAVHICFEVVFPQLSREFCRRGAALLTTITNDAWFGNSSAPHQHFAMAVMRAIENRRYLVRVANTGISGIVDPYGRVLYKTGIYVPAQFAGEVKWVHEQTFYARFGNVLVYVAMLLCVAFAVAYSWPLMDTDVHG